MTLVVTHTKVSAVSPIPAPTGIVTPTDWNANHTLTAAGLSLVGVTGSAAANVADIVGTANQVPIVNNAGTALAFVTISGDLTNATGVFTIANAAVTYAKMQNVAASRLLGNPTGSPAAPSEITLGAAFAFSGSALQTVAFTGDVTTPANSVATTIAANAVSNAKFRQSAGFSVVGLAGSGPANVADITASAADQILRGNTAGTAIGWGSINLAGANAVGTSILGAANGGTGGSTLTAHAVLLGEGTSAVAFATIGTSGRLLLDQGAGADPSFNAMSGDATITNTGAITVSKVNGHNPIAVADGGTNYTGGAWSTYTATLVPNTGSITQGGSASFLQIGKLVFYTIAVTVTGTSGAPASFDITLPVAVKRDTVIVGKELVNTGNFLNAGFSAGATLSSNKVHTQTLALQAPTVNDEYLFSGSYEAQ